MEMIFMTINKQATLLVKQINAQRYERLYTENFHHPVYIRVRAT